MMKVTSLKCKLIIAGIVFSLVPMLTTVMIVSAVMSAVAGADNASRSALPGEFGGVMIPITITGTITETSVDLRITGAGIDISGVEGPIANASYTAGNRDTGGSMPLSLPTDPPASLTHQSWMPQLDQRFYAHQLDRTSAQYRLNKSCLDDENGFRRFGDSYLVALGSYYGSAIGQKYTLSFRQPDRTVLRISAVLGDQKSDAHTDALHRYQISDKTVVEFIMSSRSDGNATVINRTFGTLIGVSRGGGAAQVSGEINADSEITATGNIDGIPLVGKGSVENGNVLIFGMYGTSDFGNAEYGGGKFLWPVPGRTYMSSGFGYRIDPYGGGRVMHDGIDIPAPVGTPIVAAAAGTVIRSEWNISGFGNYIVIDHGGGTYTGYAHADARLVVVGDKVFAGRQIATVGSTGQSTGPHLHFLVCVGGTAKANRTNPMDFLR
jgi:murein DD-endopeptidase MepM/ murein hydrolase activator NlpD